MSNFNTKNVLRAMMASRGYNQTTLQEAYEQVTGKKMVRQTFSSRINEKKITMADFLIFCDMLGYDLEVKPKKNMDGNAIGGFVLD